MRVRTWVFAAGLAFSGISPALAGDRDVREPARERAAQADRAADALPDREARDDAEDRRVLANRARFYQGLGRLRGGGRRIDPFPARGN
jgi:hypothetical protein